VDFSYWLSIHRVAFPVKRNITTYLHDFINDYWVHRDSVAFEYRTGVKYLSPTKITYIQFNFKSSSVYVDMPSFAAENEFKKWEQLVQEINSQLPETVNKCFQISDVWVRVFTEIVAVQGVEKGLIVSSLVALIGLIIFTGNIIVSLIAAIVLSANIIYMLAFYQLIGWSLGAIEAISITILVGLSVDYLFHVADAYCGAETHHGQLLNRYERVRQALTEMGVSVISGAMTTIGSGIMLTFCTIQIFSKFGIIISLTLGLSIMFALFLFPAILSVVGPVGKMGSFVPMARFIYKKVLVKHWEPFRTRFIDSYLPSAYRRM